MAALCGVWAPSLAEADGVGDVVANLAPYGSPHRWTGEVGCSTLAMVGLGEAGGASALAESSDGMLVVTVDSALGGNDAAVVLDAYTRWGEDCVDHLNGPFAFVLADRGCGCLLLVRDAVGSRPLAYAHQGSTLLWGSTSLSLTGFPSVGHELDLQRVAETIVLAYGSERTFVKGVRTVPPGSILRFDGATLSVRSWWCPNGMKIEDAGSLEAHGTLLREALDAAVGDAIRNSAAPAVLVSGGLDSTSIAALAARRLGARRLPTYTSAPPEGWEGDTIEGWIPDERFAVHALAERYPVLQTNFLDVRGMGMFDNVEPLWELGAGPARNPMNVMWYLGCIESAAADGVDVMLYGAAGNLAFSADGPEWLVALLKRGRFVRFAQEFRDFVGVGARPRVAIRRDVIKLLLPAKYRSRRAARRGRLPIDAWLAVTAIRRDRLAELNLDELLPHVSRPFRVNQLRDTVNLFRGMAAQAETELAIRGRWGVELRDPTGDRRVIDTALKQPEWWRRHAGRDRAVAREAMKDLLPSEIVDRITLGAQLPDWLDRLTEMRDDVLAELEEMRDHPASREVIDVQRLITLTETWPDRSQMADDTTVGDYYLALTRAISVSRYLRWFEARARRVAAGGPRVVLPEM